MSIYRSSTGALGYTDEPARGGERWDRERFERMRGRGGGGGSRVEHDHYRLQEHERFPGGRRDIDIHEDVDRRRPQGIERERYREEDRLARPPWNHADIFHEPTPLEVANQALAPYRRRTIVERDMDIAPRRPARPHYIRRQSSLDTFDRRPLPRYDDLERHEYRLPPNVPIPLPIRRRSPPRFREEEYEKVQYTERDRRAHRTEEEYREIEAEQSKSSQRRSRSRAAKSVAQSSSRSSSSSSSERAVPQRADWGKKGKTRLPKRLCKKQAVVELGYPYEEEDDFIVITRALEKEHIDEIIKVSENYKETKTTYVYEEKTGTVEPPPPPGHSHHAPPPPSQYAPPPPPPGHSHHAPPPPSRHEHFEERIEESNHISGPVAVLVPEERRLVRNERETRSEREIRDEIRMLEHERRMLKYEREGDYEFVERREPKREVVRVDKDRKVRREPNPKLIAAMMSTLT